MEVTFQYTEDDLRVLAQQHSFWRRWADLWLFLGCVLLAMILASILPAALGYWLALQIIWGVSVVAIAGLLVLAIVRRAPMDLSKVLPMTMRLEDDYFLTRNDLVWAKHDWSGIRRVDRTRDHLLLYTDNLHAYIIATDNFASTAAADAFYDFAQRKSAGVTGPPEGKHPRWPLADASLLTASDDPSVIRREISLTVAQLMQLDYYGLNPPALSALRSSLTYIAILSGASMAVLFIDGEAARIMLCFTLGLTGIATASSVHGRISRWAWRRNLNPKRLETMIATYSPRGVSRCSASIEEFAEWSYYEKFTKSEAFFVLHPREPFSPGDAIAVSAFNSPAEAATFEALASEHISPDNQSIPALAVFKSPETGNPYQPPLQDV